MLKKNRINFLSLLFSFFLIFASFFQLGTPARTTTLEFQTSGRSKLLYESWNTDGGVCGRKSPHGPRGSICPPPP
ncbi:Hypothetical predicted protein [Olea europaea subsp. europaea]|uniref:Uncharacterized protein n=1 Tax=Olea europaea subsp. europaea TaxID=158383 RepID=A0A8S0PM70_OLEEU|nr:Hypothetical predicted protein [Olea europaea subsp. europaea]